MHIDQKAVDAALLKMSRHEAIPDGDQALLFGLGLAGCDLLRTRRLTAAGLARVAELKGETHAAAHSAVQGATHQSILASGGGIDSTDDLLHRLYLRQPLPAGQFGLLREQGLARLDSYKRQQLTRAGKERAKQIHSRAETRDRSVRDVEDAGASEHAILS